MNKKSFFLLMAIAMFTAFNSTQAKDIALSSHVTCMTSNCHENFSKNQYIHSPLKAKGCIVCHELVKSGPKNKKLPGNHINVASGLGPKQIPVCEKCHVEWMDKLKSKPIHHSAIDKRGCTACHNPHGGDNAKFLKEKEFNQTLCLSCHKKNENWEKGDKGVTHGALTKKDKCLNCHEIHAGTHKKMLKDEPVKLCMKCHEDIVANKDKGSLHTPVKNGECLKCHSQHYGEKDNLLSKTYDGEEGYVKNVDESFALCLSCHTPMKSSKFSNGDKNLHSSHIKAKFNGLEHGCSVCHEVHGSTQPMQIKTKFTYKKNLVPIVFKKTENGGNCTTACHSNKGYDRVTPVVNPEGR